MFMCARGFVPGIFSTEGCIQSIHRFSCQTLPSIVDNEAGSCSSGWENLFAWNEIRQKRSLQQKKNVTRLIWYVLIEFWYINTMPNAPYFTVLHSRETYEILDSCDAPPAPILMSSCFVIAPFCCRFFSSSIRDQLRPGTINALVREPSPTHSHCKIAKLSPAARWMGIVQFYRCGALVTRAQHIS